MTQEQKSLLLQDICARLPFGVILTNGAKVRSIDVLTKIVSGIGTDKKIEDTKYYLRPMSSMTSQEWCELCDCDTEDEKAAIYIKDGRRFVSHINKETFLNSRHFDHRGLIGKGLAIEAPEGMYNN